MVILAELEEVAEDTMEEEKRGKKKTLKYQRGPIESTRPYLERAGRDDSYTGDRCQRR